MQQFNTTVQWKSLEFCGFFTLREEPGISLSIVNSKARLDPALNSRALHAYYSKPEAQ